LFASGFLACVALVACVGLLSDGSEAEAKASPVKALDDREVYYPGTEDLAPDEMRVTACGTGMPSVRPKQAAACWLVELGNGDKFLFDIGAQSMSRIAAMNIPMDYLDKVFIGHLHTDHMGDLPILWTGGRKMNRTVPLRVWGPSGETPEMGITASIEGLKQFLLWDDRSLQGRLDARAAEWEVNEFDYNGVNEVVYQENGVTIRSIPAVHALDGAVSYILEWNGFKFAYSSDTSPNKWWLEHAKSADISVHECFAPPEVLIEKQKYDPTFALWLSTLGHTSPAQFGKVMAMTEPRMAVGYHFYNDHDTLPLALQGVRTTYDGPVALATDFMVFNVTRDDIRVRMAVVDQDIWPLPPTRPKVVKQERQLGYGEFTASGEVIMRDVLEQVWSDVNEKYGIDAKLPPESSDD
jgi:ribonuclease Z